MRRARWLVLAIERGRRHLAAPPHLPIQTSLARLLLGDKISDLRMRAAGGPAAPRPRALDVALICAVLAGITIAGFSGLLSSTFLNFDDDGYVTGNAHVRQGLSAESIAWAFSSVAQANWHPLTWI